MENKIHYKLHKVKKQWVTIAVASVALATVLGGLSVTTSSVSADETQDKTVTQSNSGKQPKKPINVQIQKKQMF